MLLGYTWRHGTQAQHNDNRHDGLFSKNQNIDTHYNIMLSDALPNVVMQNAFILSVVIPNVFILSIIILSVIILSFILLSVILLNVIILSVVMLSVVASTGYTRIRRYGGNVCDRLHVSQMTHL
jgi:hypothetical protein